MTAISISTGHLTPDNHEESMLKNRPKAPRHILSADQFDRSFLDYLYHLTNIIRRFDKSKEGLLYLQSLLHSHVYVVSVSLSYFRYYWQ